MACSTMQRTVREQEEFAAALKDLEKDLVAGKLKVSRNAKGELTIEKWRESRAAKAGWCDGCAMAAIANQGSWMAKRILKEQGNVANGKTFNTVGHGHPHKVPR
mgnify:CR=1 FL=1